MIKRGFSLMEMMVVLLIVAIIAAASAPMINKKMLSEIDTGSPWLWKSDKKIAWFNAKNSNEKTLVVGDLNLPSSLKTRLFIKSSDDIPQLTLADNSSANYLKTLWRNKSLILSTRIPNTIPPNSISIGYNAEASQEGSIAIGAETKAETFGGTAIGYRTSAQSSYSTAIGANANSNYSSTAIGNNAAANGSYSTAIGYNATANGSSSIAIGYHATANGNYQIVLGSSSSTVYIPGNLVVNKIAITDGNGFYMNNKGGHSIGYWNSVGIAKENGCDYYYPSMRSANTPTWVSTALSDRRLKNVGEAFKGGLTEVKKLDVYNYTFKKDANKTPMVGVMAQDLQKIFPDAVIKGEDGYLRIRMEDMFYALVNAVKELDTKITAITKEIKTVIADIASLKAKTDNQAKEISELRAQNATLIKQNADFEKRLIALEKKVK